MSATPPPHELGVLRWGQLNGFPDAEWIARDAEAHARALERWLDERGLNREILADLPEDPVTLDQWAQFIGENPVTVKSWRRGRPDFDIHPCAARPRWAIKRRGRVPDVFSLAELDAYPRPRDRRIDPLLFEEDENLTLHEIAERAGLPQPKTALHQYNNDHHRVAGFPSPVAAPGEVAPNNARLYHACSFAEWFNDSLPGRRGRRAR